MEIGITLSKMKVPEVLLPDQYLPKSNKSLIAISMEQFGKLFGLLVSRRITYPTVTEMNLPILMVNSFLVLGGLPFADFMIFLRCYAQQLVDDKHVLINSGYWEQLTYEANIIINRVQQCVVGATDCPYYFLLACKQK